MLESPKKKKRGNTWGFEILIYMFLIKIFNRNNFTYHFFVLSNFVVILFDVSLSALGEAKRTKQSCSHLIFEINL